MTAIGVTHNGIVKIKIALRPAATFFNPKLLANQPSACDDLCFFCDKTVVLDHLAKLRQHLPSLAKQYRVKSLGVFGSYVRQEQHQDSDIDLLVAFDEPPSLLKFIELENHLTDLLGGKVDLVMQDALKPAIGRQVLSEVRQV